MVGWSPPVVPVPSAAASLRNSNRTLRWFLMGLLLLAAHLNPVTAAPDCSGTSHKKTRYKALVCWLWKAKVTLPKEQFHEEVFTINVNDMICTNFEVKSMKSTVTPSYTQDLLPNPKLEMNLEGMSAKCTGKYDLSGIGASGNIVASVTSSSATDPTLHLQVDLTSKTLQDQPTNNTSTKASLPFPYSATMSACQPNFLVNDIQFSGSISAKVIGLFSGTISKKVTSSINENLCTPIKTNGENVLNKGLHDARDYIASLVLDSSREVENTLGFTEIEGHFMLDKTTKKQQPQLGKSITWDRDLPFLKRILLGTNAFIAKHLNEGVILQLMQKLSTWQSSMSTADCKDCGFFFKGFNGLVNSLTKGSGSIEMVLPEQFLNFHHNHTINTKYGDIVLTAHKVKVSGINNFTDLTLLRPEEANLLSSKIASDAGFDVSLLVDLEVRPAGGAVFQGNTLNETFELQFSTSNFDFKSSSAWDLDPEIFSKLSVGSFMFGSYTMFDNNRNLLNCIIEALSSVALLNMEGRMDLDSVLISPVVPANEANGKVSLEDNIDELINNVLQMILVQYPATTTEAVAGLIQTPVKKMLNDGLANLVGDTKKMPLHCVNIDIPKNKSEHPLRLDSNKALMLFNQIVDDKSTIAVMNSFIECVVNAVESKKLLAGHFFSHSIGDYSIVFHDLHMENANSVYEVELLKPEIDHYHLTNSFGYAMCPAGKGRHHSSTSFSFGMNLAHSQQGNMGNVNIHINMKNLKLHGGAEIKFDMNYLPSVFIHDLVAHPQCVSTPLTGVDFYGLNATIEMLDIKIDVSLNDQDGGPRSFTYQTEDPAELASDVSTLLFKGSVLLQEALGGELLAQFRQASKVCTTPVNPHRSYDAKRSTGGAGLWTFFIILAFIAGNAWLFLRGFKKEDELSTRSEQGEVQLDEQQESR